MIADIYYCPHCGIDVYLGQEEQCCPHCGEMERHEMELVELGVDLAHKAWSEEGTEYAGFGHLMEVLSLRYGDRAGLYAMDCWKYAWNVVNTDTANLHYLNPFLDNPNRILLGKRDKPMTEEELQKEVARIIGVVYAKTSFPRNLTEWASIEWQYSELNKYPIFRIYIKNDFSYVAAEACFKHARMNSIYNYNQLEKGRPIPNTKKDYLVFNCSIDNLHPKTIRKGVSKMAPKLSDKMAKGIVYKCFPHKWWEIWKWRPKPRGPFDYKMQQHEEV